MTDKNPEKNRYAARKLRRSYGDDYPTCAICGNHIELYIDIRNEFPDYEVYWQHVGYQQGHPATPKMG